MATRKKTTPAVESEIKTVDTSTDAATETNVAEKKTTAKKTAAKTSAKKTTTAKKTDTKSTATKKKTVKKETVDAAETAPVVEAPASAPKAEVFIEFGGAQVSVDDIISNAKKIVGDNKDIKIYVQPSNSKAYIAFGEESVSMDVFFC